MKTKWLIQSSGFNQSNVLEIYKTLKRLSIDVSDFGLIPFTNTITNLENILEPDTKFIMKSGTKILTILNSINKIEESNDFLSENQKSLSKYYINKLKCSIDYDLKKFDQEYYSKLNLPLLNNNAIYKKYKDSQNKIYKKDMFIKPSKELKAFNGGILKKGTSVKEFILKNTHQSYYVDETIIISELQYISKEYRFFIIEDKVIIGSQYIVNGIVKIDNFIPNYILNIAKEYAKLYKPANIFVMDLAETKTGIKIVEYNCWNASGIYNCNAQKLFNEINEYKMVN